MVSLNRKKRIFFLIYSVVGERGNSVISKDRFIFIKFFNYYGDRRELDD